MKATAQAGLLVIDNALDHEFYRPVDHWTDTLGFSPESVYPPGGDTLPDVDEYTHVIVTGSEGMVSDMPEWTREEARWVKEAIDAGVAVLGSCWGHQLIAFAMAGLQAVRRAATPESGWISVSVAQEGGLLSGASFQSFASHFEEVVAGCHPELQVLATTPSCGVHAARWGDRSVWGLQAHPEIGPEAGKEFLAQAAERWPDWAPLFRSALGGPVQDSGAGKVIARRFLEVGKGPDQGR
jgi:GMP synthase-like glutamine amidotransferase